jgi:hypothetical protein
MTAAAPSPVTLDMVIQTNVGGSMIVTGQLTPGAKEHPVSSQLLFQFPGYSYFNPPCTAWLKTYSLIEYAGQSAGNRVGRYLLTVSPADGTVSGKVRFQDYDMGGKLVNVANGTFTGRSISADINPKDGDPFWAQ